MCKFGFTIFIFIALLSCSDNGIIFNNGITGTYHCIISVDIDYENKDDVSWEQCGQFIITESTYELSHYNIDDPESLWCRRYMNECQGEYEFTKVGNLFNMTRSVCTTAGYPDDYSLGGLYYFTRGGSGGTDSLILWQTKTKHFSTGNGEFDVTYDATIRMEKKY